MLVLEVDVYIQTYILIFRRFLSCHGDIPFATVRNIVLLIMVRCCQDIWLAGETEDGFDTEDLEIDSRFI